MRHTYHLVTPSAWNDTSGDYRADSLATEGFIHCSNENQVGWAANKFYARQEALLVLTIDAARLISLLRDEDVGHGESFPHIYGPINRDAVVNVQTLERDAEGRWTFSR